MGFGPDDIATEMGVRVYGADFVKRAELQAIDTRNSGWHPIVREPFMGAWQQNKEISYETQLAFYAVYACITLIANDIGKLRPRLVELDQNGIWKEAESPAYTPVLRKPNRYQNHIQFKEWWAMSKLTRGNAYALKQRDARGVVTGLYLLNPLQTRPMVAPDGAVFYELRADALNGLDNENPVLVPAREIIHDRINCLFHPLVGISPLYACGIAAGHGLAIQEQAATFFKNGARVSGVLTAPGAISQTTADRAAAAFNAGFSGANAGKVAVLGDGLKFEPMAMNSNDAQLVEQLGLTAKTVCSVFHVPPAKIGLEQDASASNAEIRDRNYYSDCLQSHIEQWELCMDEGLGIGYGIKVEGRVLGVDLDLDGLMRMDSAAQMKTLVEGIKGSAHSINEARRKLDLPPVDGGDSIWMQQQNYSLEALMERDANDPFGKQEPVVPTPAAEPEEPEIDEEKLRAALALSLKDVRLERSKWLT